MIDVANSIWQKLTLRYPEPEMEIWVKRDDLIHVDISGNKWRKLKYYDQKARALKSKELLTFGGAFSNHILATAAFGFQNGIKTRGIIRGREVDVNNPTLLKARKLGMQLHLISRSDYKLKKEEAFLDQLKLKFPGAFIIPEGGSGFKGVQGCIEIMDDAPFDSAEVYCAGGTGTTASGLLMAEKTSVLNVVPVLKGGGGVVDEIKLNLSYFHQEDKIKQLNSIDDAHFGGYGKVTEDLKSFISYIYQKYQLPLDGVYTAKAFWAMLKDLEKNKNSNSKNIVFYHSGGLQGNKGLGIKL